MMSDNLFKIWERGKKMEANAPAVTLDNMARKGAGRFTKNLYFYLWTYLGALGAILVLEMMNLRIYHENSLMMWIHGAIITLSLLFGGYGIVLLAELRATRRMDADTKTLISRRLAFFSRRFETWMVIIPIVVILLTMAINTYTDHMDGSYRINKPTVFVSTMIVVYAFCYAMMKISVYPSVKEMRAYLSDLDAQVREETPKIEKFKARWRIVAIVVAIFALAFFILGILMFARNG